MAEVELREHDRRVGYFVFDEHPPTLHAKRTSSGFNLTIPGQVGLASASEGEPQLGVNNIQLVLSISAGETDLEVGRISHNRFYSAYVTHHNAASSEELQPMELTWSAQLPDLFAIEKARAGNNPEFNFEIRANLFFIITGEQWQDHVRSSRKRFPVLTEPRSIFKQTRIVYPETVWSDMVRTIIRESGGDPLLRLLPSEYFPPI
jgi:hypothetical protein